MRKGLPARPNNQPKGAKPRISATRAPRAIARIHQNESSELKRRINVACIHQQVFEGIVRPGAMQFKQQFEVLVRKSMPGKRKSAPPKYRAGVENSMRLPCSRISETSGDGQVRATGVGLERPSAARCARDGFFSDSDAEGEIMIVLPHASMNTLCYSAQRCCRQQKSGPAFTLGDAERGLEANLPGSRESPAGGSLR